MSSYEECCAVGVNVEMGERDTSGEGLTEVKRMSVYYTLICPHLRCLLKLRKLASGVGTKHQDGREFANKWVVISWR